MSDIYSIAKSGLQAYREGLAATGQNIANIGNENYARREVDISELKSSSADVLQVSTNTSFGVKVDGVTRAFDQFIDIQLQKAQTNFSFSTAQTLILEQLETLVRPQAAGVSQKINEFFSKLNDVGQDPSDLAGRNVALDAANSLSYSIRSVATGIKDLRGLAASNLNVNVDEANNILQQLAAIQKELVGATSLKNVPNGLLDERDGLLKDLSELLDINVHYKNSGEVEIRSGTNGQGIFLLAGIQPSHLKVETLNGSLKVFASSSPNELGTKLSVQSGEMAGHISADNTLLQTKSEIDHLAKKLTTEFNAVQNFGLDLDGEIGEDIFDLNAINVIKTSQLNSDVELKVLGDYDQFIGQTLVVKFNADRGSWSVSGLELLDIPQFQDELNLDGLKLAISGSPSIGDYFEIEFQENGAENLSVKISDGRKIAASSLYLVEDGLTNLGNASLSVTKFPEPKNTQLDVLNGIFSGISNSANATTFRNSGALGFLENVNNINNLTALKLQPSLQFSFASSQLNANSILSIDLDNVQYDFAIGGYLSDGSDYGDLAELLNAGVIKSTNPGLAKSFNDLGLRAAGGTSLFNIYSSKNSGAPGVPNLTSGTIDGRVATFNPGSSETANIQIFTKEGVHLAGSPLSSAEAAILVSEQNGFARNAEYTAGYFSTGVDSTYLGANVTRKTASGDYGASFYSSGALLPQSNNFSKGFGVPPIQTNTMPLDLKLVSSTGETLTLKPVQGMMAGHVSEAINRDGSILGIGAKSHNQLELFEVPDGLLEFTLKGKNSSAISVGATVNVGDISSLVSSINEQTDKTGIAAFVVNNGSLILENLDGNDIVLADISLPNGGAFKARQLDQFGQIIKPTNSPGELTLSNNEFLVAGGQVLLNSAIDFDVQYDGAVLGSSQSEFINGFATKNFDLKNNVQEIEFFVDSGIDGGHTSESGLSAVSASSSYALNIGTDIGDAIKLSARVDNLNAQQLTQSSLVQGLTSQLRAQSPKSVFTGGQFNLADGYPKNGDTLELQLGDELYLVTINNVPEYSFDGQSVVIDGTTFTAEAGLAAIVSETQFAVSGPEVGRLEVGFQRFAGTDDFQFYAVAKDGVISGQVLGLTGSNSQLQLSNFNIVNSRGGQSTQMTLTGTDFAPPQVADNVALLRVEGVNYSVHYKQNGGLQLDPALNGAQATLVTNNDGTNRISITLDDSFRGQNIRLVATSISDDYGIITSSSRISVEAGKVKLKNLENGRVTLDAQVYSLADETFSINGLSGQDLIVIATGIGQANLIGSADEFDGNDVSREITVKINDPSKKVVELYDRETGDFLAKRDFGATKDFIYSDLHWQFDGDVELDDEFTLTASSNRQDDASNISNMLRLAERSDATQKGGYSDLYNELIIDVGFNVKAAEQGLQTSKALFDAAVDRKSEFSGVDLDTEAARLLEQQQAYQALAKVLSTAQQLVDTLLRAM